MDVKANKNNLFRIFSTSMSTFIIYVGGGVRGAAAPAGGRKWM
jgi:hypothetical protein